VTTDYSAADIGEPIEAANRVCEVEFREVPHSRSCEPERRSQLADLYGGKGGTRTLDPGIMSAVL
jgi:hypothetical protein